MQRWLESGALRAHRTSAAEVRDLLAVTARDIDDARVTQLSLDRRFAAAYGAALQLATVVVVALGFRVVAQRGHHAVSWQVLSEIMGAEVGVAAVYFDSCRALRNRSDLRQGRRRFASRRCDFEPELTVGVFRICELRYRLEDLLGLPVDVVTTGGLRPEIRDEALNEAIRAAQGLASAP